MARQIYTDKQDQLLRDHLNRVYELGQAKRGKAYSWSKLANAIERRAKHSTDEELKKLKEGINADAVRTVDLGKDNLRKFARGVRQHNGSYRVQELETDEKYAAVELWLTDPQNKLSTLTREELYVEDLGEGRFSLYAAEAAKYLGRLFFFSPRPIAGVSAPVLDGSYVSVRTDRGRRITWRLSFDQFDTYVLEANAHEITTKESRFLGQVPSSQSDYVGWAIATPEDNVIVYLRHLQRTTNHFLLTLAIDPNFYQSEKVQHLMLLDHQNPLTLNDPDDPDSSAGLIAEWQSDALCKALIFKRE